MKKIFITLLILLITSLSYAAGDLAVLDIDQIDGSGGGGGGNVVGPASSTDNAIPRFDGITGELLQNTSIYTVDDSGKSILTSTLNAATGNEVAYTLNYATNKATSGNDTGLLINMTDTASPGTSYIINAQKGGTSVFRVDETGQTIFKSLILTTGIQCTNIGSIGANNTLTLMSSSFTFSVSDNAIEMVAGTFSGAGVTQNAVVIMPTVNQTTTSSMTDLLINRTETAVGSGAQYITQYQVGAANLEALTNKGHHVVDDAVTASFPVLSACGTSPTLTAGSNDYAGTFVIGATGTGCTITFGTAYTNTPACVCSGSAAITNTQTNAVLTVVAVPGTYNYHCVGLNSGI